VARQLSGLGGRFEVLSPPSVGLHLADIGRTLVEHYGTAPHATAGAESGAESGGGVPSARSDG
jgi:hypothetical protein